ncbi:hypothetical protein BTR40_21815 [Vibrio parahaemolyticus]|uniref:hypothetical protein n=1 Tax=Vibrio parahaemolyticus TaxID=670 RepID=UPI000A37DABC|nr:hypothetical protein [Vibrio parahaemolyticus]OUJ34090.1 hypothetical protein BTR40_21815 [Vibrio parahaemolyticus]
MKKIIMVLVGGSLLAGCANHQVTKYRGDDSKPIIVTDYYQKLPNTAGGVEVSFTAFNMSEKPIKYLDFYGKHFDRIGEQTNDRITGAETKGYRFVGPYKSEARIYGRFGPSFYNGSAHCMMIDSLKVTYMDSTELELQGDKLKDVLVIGNTTCRNLINR